MSVSTLSRDPVDAFIARWEGAQQAERANYVSFLNELCGVISVPLLDVASGGGGNYRFERSVVHHAPEGGATTRRMDLYRRDRFILEAKQAANAEPQASIFGLGETERRSNVRKPRSGRGAWWRRRGRRSGISATCRQTRPARLS